MRPFLTSEFRLQQLERRVENIFRLAKVIGVKYENKRWYVQCQEGDGTEDETLTTDWVPWQSFSHGAIKFSVPPRNGQKITLSSPNGEIEQCFASPFHYDPSNPSPNDKQDEFFVRIEKPSSDGSTGQNPDETLDIHATKDFKRTTIGKTKTEVTKENINHATVYKNTVAEQLIRDTVSDQRHIVDNKGVRAVNGRGNMVLLNTGDVFLNC